MRDKPTGLPFYQPTGGPLKPIVQVMLDRRATSHFDSEPIPHDYLQAILQIATQAPSGYNLQPWRFIIVQEEENRKRLRRAAYDQEKVSQAPVVVIFIGLKDTPRHQAGTIIAEGARRGAGQPDKVAEVTKQALGFLSHMSMDLWVNRHVMIAFTTMMLAAEAYGFDTAPMEGFDPNAVKKEFGIPDEAEVVALLAMGRVKEPDRQFPGRFGLDEIAFKERYGAPWITAR